MNAITRGLRSFGAFWWDFIVGDDWRIAAGVVIALAATVGLVHAHVAAWWLPPIAAVGMLAFSLLSARGADRPAAAATAGARVPDAPRDGSDDTALS
ncbi:MAG: hypothetical protein ACR2LF_06045 [Jatrophihabitantaceae bacterium]